MLETLPPCKSPASFAETTYGIVIWDILSRNNLKCFGVVGKMQVYSPLHLHCMLQGTWKATKQLWHVHRSWKERMKVEVVEWDRSCAAERPSEHEIGVDHAKKSGLIPTEGNSKRCQCRPEVLVKKLTSASLKFSQRIYSCIASKMLYVWLWCGIAGPIMLVLFTTLDNDISYFLVFPALDCPCAFSPCAIQSMSMRQISLQFGWFRHFAILVAIVYYVVSINKLLWCEKLRSESRPRNPSRTHDLCSRGFNVIKSAGRYSGPFVERLSIKYLKTMQKMKGFIHANTSSLDSERKDVADPSFLPLNDHVGSLYSPGLRIGSRHGQNKCIITRYSNASTYCNGVVLVAWNNSRSTKGPPSWLTRISCLVKELYIDYAPI